MEDGGWIKDYEFRSHGVFGVIPVRIIILSTMDPIGSSTYRLVGLAGLVGIRDLHWD